MTATTDKTDPWDELMEVARSLAINSEMTALYCGCCGAEWPSDEAEHHEPDCLIRDDREDPYAELMEAAKAVIASGRLKSYPVLDERLRAALAKAEGKQ